MAPQNSFDIVSEVDRAEVTNAINQTIKEVRQRFDFKGSHANVALETNELVLTAEDETKLRNMNDILQQKLVRRGVPLKAFSYGTVDPALGGTVRQKVQIQQGIPQDKAKEVVKSVAESLNMPYVAERWIGGTISNFVEIKKRIAELENYRKDSAAGDLDKYTKKERVVNDDEANRLLMYDYRSPWRLE